ncbi:hypothetical protein GTPT_1719 [Tatumella ptyseos ATCC 33301]|uniref:Uncharacterized protein n=1 Tax=Tatumella ptyseos ATCC 33301 TaxID=1005995 RepID=A0A085JH41_9GAMM|nr:hypothetical protein GTPT_1719 [Tatumella ptyseos ATCC 33301]
MREYLPVFCLADGVLTGVFRGSGLLLQSSADRYAARQFSAGSF